MLVNGNLTVIDPTKKHGAIQHPDGSLRLLYSMESPESRLEDFGKGQLVGGKAEVRLDLDFVAVTHTDDYLIFLTPRGDTQGLTISTQTTDRFTVQELNGGTGSASFYWRVVAKPKSENKATRLAKFSVPQITVPQPPPWPQAQQVQPAQPGSRPSSSTGAAQGGPQSPVQNPVQPMPQPRSG